MFFTSAVTIADFLGVYSVYSVKSKYRIYSDLEGGGWTCIIAISVTAMTSADGKIMVIIHREDTDASLGGSRYDNGGGRYSPPQSFVFELVPYPSSLHMS